MEEDEWGRYIFSVLQYNILSFRPENLYVDIKT